jgi:hypothetical protein
MVMLRCLIFCLLLPGFLFLSLESQAQKENIDWKKDILFLKKALPSKHVDLFRNISEKDFNRMLDDLLVAAESMTDLEIRIALQQVIAKVGDTHTNIELGAQVFRDGMLPLQLYWFADGIYILHTLPVHKAILGNRITSINDFPIETIVDSLSTIFVKEESGYLKNFIPKYLPIAAMLRKFSFATGEKFKLGLQDTSGRTWYYPLATAELNRRNREVLMPDSLNLILRNENAWFDVQYLQNDSILYVMYNKCWSRELALKYDSDAENLEELPSFSEFEAKVIKMATELPLSKIVVDLRFNKGGNSSQGTAFVEKLATIPSLKLKGKMFVVIGRATFSSAVLNAMDFKSQTNAVFVGERAGGTPNHFGEVKTFQLPSSGLKVSYSTKYFTRTKSAINTLDPDFPVDFNFSDFIRGEDAAYNFIRNYH